MTDLKSVGPKGRAGSTPAPATNLNSNNMKKFIFALSLTLITSMGWSQQIIKVIDTMSDRFYWVDEGLLFLNDDNSAGFRITADFKRNSDVPVFEGLDFKVAGLGTCVENVQIIILFKDGSKITKTSWNDFNCEGYAWYNFNRSEIETISTVGIDKVRVTNGRTYDTLTLEAEDPNHFVEVARLAAANEYEVLEQ